MSFKAGFLNKMFPRNIDFSYEISAESFNARFGLRPELYVGKIIPQKYQEC